MLVQILTVVVQMLIAVVQCSRGLEFRRSWRASRTVRSIILSRNAAFRLRSMHNTQDVNFAPGLRVQKVAISTNKYTTGMNPPPPPTGIQRIASHVAVSK